MAGATDGEVLKIYLKLIANNKEMIARAKKAASSAGMAYNQSFQKAYNKSSSQANAFKQKRFELKNILPKDVYARVQKEFTNLGRTVQGKLMTPLERLNLANKKVQSSIKNVAVSAKKARVPFAGWAMSIMFFGMALNRIFRSIWKSSTKTFQDVMHSVDGTTTQFDMLQGSTKYLGFVVGEALQPIVGKIIPIVDAISDWVSVHPKLTAEIVKWGMILGTLFAAGGAVVLASNGFKELKNIITGVGTTAGVSADKTVVASSRMVGALSAVGKVAAIAVSFYFAEKSLEDFTTGNYLDSAINAMIAAGSFIVFSNPYLGGTLLAVGFTLKFVESGASTKLVDWFQRQLSIISSMWNDFVSRVKSFGLFNAGEAASRARNTFLTGGGFKSTVFDRNNSSSNQSVVNNTYYIEGAKITAGSIDDALDIYNQRLKLGILNG